MDSFHPKTQENQEFQHKNERGSVILWILIAVALFGALSFVFSKGMRTGESKITDEKARLLASEIIDYGRTVRQAVHMLQINGCEDTEISFDNTVVGGYTNTNAPTDDSCDVFEPEGAGLNWIEPNFDGFDRDFEGGGMFQTSFYNWYYTGIHCIDDVGSCANGSEASLMMFLPNVKDSVCENINEKMEISTPIPADNLSFFTGMGEYGTDHIFYETGIGSIQILTSATIAGKQVGCIQDNVGGSSGSNFFYQVLIAR